MTTVGVREMKANLSRYLRLVRERQTDVVVTARGRTVARLVPAAAALSGAREALASLAAGGLLELPEEPRRRTARKPVMPTRAGGQSLAEMIIEDRR